MTTRSTAAAAAALAALGLTPLAAAQTLEFEDLPASSVYPVGGSFITEGVQVNVDAYQGASGGTASVLSPGSAGSGNEILAFNAMLDFQFDFPLTTIGFAWSEFGVSGGNVGISVNGVEVTMPDVPDFHATVQGGASISVVSEVGGSVPSGYATITGVINQFSVGGQEIFIDDVRRVPAPAATLPLALGAIAASRRRRCRR